MQVSFQGFRNAGVERLELQRTIFSPVINYTAVNVELTNKNGKDLDNFDKILKTASNQINKNFLKIALNKRGENLNNNHSTKIFYVNDKEIPINRETLDTFGPIARFLTRMINTPNEDFKVSKDYLESEDVINSFIDTQIHPSTDLIEAMHAPDTVKKYAKELLDEITDSIDDALS